MSKTSSDKYVESFPESDRDRIFRFFATFSRWECALKRYYPQRGPYGVAQAGWNQFAKRFELEIVGNRSTRFEAARQSILDAPPEVQICSRAGEPTWEPNPQREGETEAQYSLRIVRDVRNNLFHGGKFVGGPIKELARDRFLLDVSTILLEELTLIDPRIAAVFDESL